MEDAKTFEIDGQVKDRPVVFIGSQSVPKSMLMTNPALVPAIEPVGLIF